MTPNSPDYRLYLEEHFKRLDDKLEGLTKLNSAQFEIVYDKLDDIKEETSLTNGRVLSLEKKILTVEGSVAEHPFVCAANSKVIKLVDEINLLKTDVDLLKDEVTTFKEDLIEYRIFKKYPKLGMILITVFVLMFTFSAISVIQNYKSDKKQDVIIEQSDTINKQT